MSTYGGSVVIKNEHLWRIIWELCQEGFDLWVGTKVLRMEVSHLEAVARAIVKELSQEGAWVLLLEEEVKGPSSNV